MSRPLLGVLFALFAQIGSATVVITVGTKDGILVCEDTRITHTDQDGRQAFTDSNHKAQRHGAFGFSATAGSLSYSEQQPIGGGPIIFLNSGFNNYDILAEIRSFFTFNDIRRFDEPMAGMFEAQLLVQLRKTLDQQLFDKPAWTTAPNPRQIPAALKLRHHETIRLGSRTTRLRRTGFR